MKLIRTIEKIANKSKLTKEDVEEISHKINKDVFEKLDKKDLVGLDSILTDDDLEALKEGEKDLKEGKAKKLD